VAAHGDHRWPSDASTWRGVLSVLALAAGLRLYPVWFGLPYLRPRRTGDAVTKQRADVAKFPI
jgi:hypothetical protein